VVSPRQQWQVLAAMIFIVSLIVALARPLMASAPLAAPVVPLPVDAALAEPGAVYAYRLVPDAYVLTVEELLDARLAAFSAAVDRTRAAQRARASVVNDPETPRFDVDGLRAVLDAQLERASQRADVAVHVRDLDTGEVLFDAFGDAKLIPASNQKIVTSAAVLDLLGADYTFATTVHLAGDALVLVGRGDPSLQVEDLRRLALEARARVDPGTIHRVLVDDTAFTNTSFAPGFEDDPLGVAYKAPSGALSVGFNVVEVLVATWPSVSGAPVVYVRPESDHVVVENTSVLRGSKRRLDVRSRRAGEQTVITVRGRLPKGALPSFERRRIHEPALHAGSVFARAFAGPETPLVVQRGALPRGARALAIHRSKPLIAIVDDVLAWSNNFIAEQLLRTLAWELTGAPGGWQNGAALLRRYWTAIGGDDDALDVENGSGLTREGRVTASALVDLLAVASAAEGHPLVRALPVAGVEGTLRSRLRTSGRRVRAKTGTIDGVTGLSGVVTDEAGHPRLAFAILINVRGSPWQMPAGKRTDLADGIVMWVLHYLDDYEARRGFLALPDDWAAPQGASAGGSSGAPDPLGP
jgi:D-alanyl-D-alanine carboxypeptidase/D-alanyl-D-alanine-endopeptidase (penicillin-binding protein 4)